jgi:SpoVK/Ycf46/Vps4 family AAA+-type ATPase
MPLATLSLAATMNSYLGKTGQNVMRALDYARNNACVLLIDEFDALAKRRGDDQDIGELKRVVNVLLQAIDQWEGPSLLIAATNHVSLLDEAIVRRFESSIEFPASTQAQLHKILLSLGVEKALSADLATRLQGQPISNATRLVRAARKSEVLQKVPFETAVRLEMNIVQNHLSPKDRRRATATSLAEGGMSSHQIAQQLGLSHTTILRDLKFSSESNQE